MGVLDHWDWQAAFAELGAEFGPPGPGFAVEAAEAVAAAAHRLRMSEVFWIHATRTEPVQFTARVLQSGGRPVEDRPAWVVIYLGEHRRGALDVAADDPLAMLDGRPAVIHAVVDAATCAVLAFAIEPVELDRPH